MAGPMDSPERRWRTEFNRQLTDAMIERLIKQTTALVRRFERKTPWREQQTEDDRLHTVMVKTLDGSLRWDPDRVDLERFFYCAISTEIRGEIKHARRFHQESIDDDDRHDTEALERETSEAIADARIVPSEVAEQTPWSMFIDALRTEAKDDDGVLAIANAYEAGKVLCGDVMTFAGMSRRQYKAAYGRLMRVAQRIDEDLRELIIQAIA